MDRIRVVIASMPRLLHDIVHSVLSSEPDFDIGSATPATRELLTPNAAHDADVIIVAERELADVDYEAMLYEDPRLRLLAIGGDGRSATLYEVRPCRVQLGALSPQSLVDAVRAQPRGLRAS